MAVVRRRQSARWRRLRQLLAAALNPGQLRRCLCEPEWCGPVAVLLLLIECIINVAIIERVKYTEIDWRAYMQEVEGVRNGTYDYARLAGDTGPLVYPAGFVYIFLALYHVTSAGQHVRLAQYLFLAVYVATVALVARIYTRSRKVPPYALLLMCLTSYRIHSIYVLRLFNDPVAMLLLYAAVNCLMDGRWSLGSLLYSLAVSVKMNILLFAPALLLAYVTSLGVWGAAGQLAICAGVQLVLGAPFLLTNPVSYMRGAFDIGRIFLYEWTVNWRFLPEAVFVDRRLHVALLVAHVLVLIVFAKYRWHRLLAGFAKLTSLHDTPETASQLLLLPLFTCNLVGVAFSRSLHYQFYVWYYHSLPYLLWSTGYSAGTKLCLLGLLELCWNTFPSTPLSSATLHCCHLAVLVGIWTTGALVNRLVPPAPEKLK